MSWSISTAINNLLVDLGTTFNTNYIGATSGNIVNLVAGTGTINQLFSDTLQTNTLNAGTITTIGQSLQSVQVEDFAIIKNNIFSNNFYPLGEVTNTYSGIVNSIQLVELFDGNNDPTGVFRVIGLFWDNPITKTQVRGETYDVNGNLLATTPYFSITNSAFNYLYGQTNNASQDPYFIVDYDSGTDTTRILIFYNTLGGTSWDTSPYQGSGNPTIYGVSEQIYINSGNCPKRVLANTDLSQLCFYTKSSEIATDSIYVDGNIYSTSNITTNSLNVDTSIQGDSLTINNTIQGNSLSITGNLSGATIGGNMVSQNYTSLATDTVPSSYALGTFTNYVDTQIQTQLNPIIKYTSLQTPNQWDYTIGSGGIFVDLQSALSSSLVRNGTILRILKNTTIDITTALTITKSVIIVGEDRDTCIIRNAIASPSLTSLLICNADYIQFYNLTINFTSTITDNFALTFQTSGGDNLKNPIVSGCRIIYNKFGIVMRGQNFIVNSCLFETQSAATTRRAIAVYRSLGDCSISNNTFNQTIDTANRLVHILETSASDTKIGSLTLYNNVSTGVCIQFVNVESYRGITDGMTYIISKNTMNESNAFVVLFNTTLNNGNTIKEVYILNNTFTNRHTTSPFGGKGCLAIDSSTTLKSVPLPVYSWNNTATVDQFFRAGYGLAQNATGIQVGITTAGQNAYTLAGYNPVLFSNTNIKATSLPSLPSEFNSDENRLRILETNYVANTNGLATNLSITGSITMSYDNLLLENSSNNIVNIRSGPSNESRISFGDSTVSNRGRIHYSNANNEFNIHTNNSATPNLRMGASGITFNGNNFNLNSLGGLTNTLSIDGSLATLRRNLLVTTGSGSTISTVSIQGITWGSIEMGGASGAYLDMKNPFSDDYDFRLQQEGNVVSLNTISSTGIYTFNSGGIEIARINSTGLGIGANNPSTWLAVEDGVNGSGNIPGISMKVLGGSTAQSKNFSVGQSDTNNVFLGWNYNATPASAYAYLDTYVGSNPLVLQSSLGNVGIGLTNPNTKLHTKGRITIEALSSVDTSAVLEMKNFAGNTSFFFTDNAGNIVLDAISNRVGIDRIPTTLALEVGGEASKATAGSWAVNSDIRVKENIEDADLDILYNNMKRLKLRRFRYKEKYHPNVRDRNVLGFIAQEVEPIYPKAIIKSALEKFKVGEDEEGNPIYEELENFYWFQEDQINKLTFGVCQKLIEKVEYLETELAQQKEQNESQQVLLLDLLERISALESN